MGDDLVSLPLLCSPQASRYEETGPGSKLTFLLFLSSTGKLPSWVQYVILSLTTAASKITSNSTGEEMTDQDSTLLGR
jgi:hypothetical protein